MGAVYFEVGVFVEDGDEFLGKAGFVGVDVEVHWDEVVFAPGEKGGEFGVVHGDGVEHVGAVAPFLVAVAYVELDASGPFFDEVLYFTEVIWVEGV